MESQPAAPAQAAQATPATPATQAKQPRQTAQENFVYVGKKNIMSYVLAVVTQFNQGLPEVHLKARGKAISRAVDVTQIVKNRFMPEMNIKSVSFSTEEMVSEDGRPTKVSSMDVAMTRG
jgi:DNA-binding protein